MNARTAKMTSFTYTTYIHATPERVWRGLTDPALTKCYWRHHMAGPKTFRSDWTKGSTWGTRAGHAPPRACEPGQHCGEASPGQSTTCAPVPHSYARRR